MNVTGRVNTPRPRFGRTRIRRAATCVSPAVRIAHAATGFVAPPTRLYMLPEAPSLLGLPSDVVTQLTNLLVPVKVMKFDGSTDLISQDVRKIEVDFPASSPDCNITPNDSNFSADRDHQLHTYPDGRDERQDQRRCPRGQVRTKLGWRRAERQPGVCRLPRGGCRRVDIGSAAADEYNLNSRQGLPSLSINGTKAQINDALKLLEYKPNTSCRTPTPTPTTCTCCSRSTDPMTRPRKSAWNCTCRVSTTGPNSRLTMRSATRPATVRPIRWPTLGSS